MIKLWCAVEVLDKMETNAKICFHKRWSYDNGWSNYGLLAVGSSYRKNWLRGERHCCGCSTSTGTVLVNPAKQRVVRSMNKFSFLKYDNLYNWWSAKRMRVCVTRDQRKLRNILIQSDFLAENTEGWVCKETRLLVSCLRESWLNSHERSILFNGIRKELSYCLLTGRHRDIYRQSRHFSSFWSKQLTRSDISYYPIFKKIR